MTEEYILEHLQKIRDAVDPDKEYILDDTGKPKMQEGIPILTWDWGNDVAHGIEDNLHRDVLLYISKNAPEPYRKLARLALETKKISFERWYA